MERSVEESIVYAIAKDDVNAYGNLPERAQRGEYRLGRFPVLSLMYLYGCKKLLTVYEEKFLRASEYEVLNEPMEASRKFAKRAGKCLRLYLSGETVTPAEMLIILDKTKKLKEIFPSLGVSGAVRSRLKKIYYIKYSLSVTYEGDGIKIQKRPLSYREKRKIATVCLSVIMCVILAVGVPLTTVYLLPKPVEGEVTAFEQIDFSSAKTYTLKADVAVPDNFSVQKTNCSIEGGGHRLVLGAGASLGELSGTLSGVTLESAGNAIFTSIALTGGIKDSTVNVKTDIEISEASAFVVQDNYGTIQNVTVNVEGKVSALDDGNDETDEFYFGGIARNNFYRYNSADPNASGGRIKNCKVNFDDFQLTGETGANASFGGIAGTNTGSIEGCTAEGKITADTFDIAGIVSVNNNIIYQCANVADISQTSADEHWNPIVAGIVVQNAYLVEDCENRGSLSAKSVCGQFEVQEGQESIVSATGIAYLNRGSNVAPYIRGCKNLGSVESVAQYRDVYATGVCISTSGVIENCANEGAITARAENGRGANAGGISGITYGNVLKSVNRGSIAVTCDGVAQAGGISSRLCAKVSESTSTGDITVEAKRAYVGGIFGYGDTIASQDYLGYTIYFGMAQSCVGDCRIDVSSSDSVAYAGGIAGYIHEEKFGSGDSAVHYGGCVTDCYFVGELISQTTYFGNVVGVCGANVYERNSYGSGDNVYHNFENNVYVANAHSAFGATVDPEGNFAEVADVGATSKTADEIRNSDGYKSIINAYLD